MNILITGGAGFIGGRICEYLINNTNYNILIATRNKDDNYLILNSRIKFFHVDWLSSNSLNKMCVGIDVIVHAAGMNVKDCQNNPQEALEFNGYATKKLINAAIDNKVSRFIYISTAHVYCAPLNGIITETHTLSNTHPYATSHAVGELFLIEAVNSRLIDGVVLRLSNAIGRPLTFETNCWMLFVNDLCQQLVETNRIVIKSNPYQVRDFIKISEICKIIIHFIMIINFKFNENIIFNVGSGKSRTLIDTGKLIKEIANKHFNIKPLLIYEHNDSVISVNQNFKYSIDKIIKTGIEIDDSMDSEIIDLINFLLSRNINSLM